MKIVSELEDMLVFSLSRKNLEGLTRQLDDPEIHTAQVMKRQPGGTLLIVVAEENEQHYAGERSGQSHPADKYGESHAA